MKNIKDIIKQLDLKPHPEGGYFKETYRSKESITSDSLPKSYENSRNYSTCIYFLLTSETFSAFHKIKQDEIWHFYDGSVIELHTISPEEKHQKHLIGKNFEQGEVPQFVVHGGNWFAAKVKGNNNYALVGCTVAPGFSFEDFVLASQSQLLTDFPQHAAIIKNFTR